MWELFKIIKNALDNFFEGKYLVDDSYVVFFCKEDVYSKMEVLIYYFKIVMGEIDVFKGEVYYLVEGVNGELGFYLVSEGERFLFCLYFRCSCFIYY